MPSLFSGLNSSTPGLNPGLNRNNSTSSPSDILNSTPSSIGGTNKDDVEALFRSLYPNGIDAVLANATNAISYTPAGTTSSTGPQPLQAPVQMPYTFLGSQQGLTSYADSSSNALAKLFGEPTSYRESSTTSAQASLDQSTNSLAGFVNTSSSFSAPQSQMNPVDGPLASQAAWSNMTDNSVNDFLASLSGANNNTDPGDLSATADEDIFSQQIAALLSAQSSSMSPSTAFNLPPNSAFSPTAYLNMSPSPLQSLSNSQTPQSTAGTSSVTSPQTDASSTSGEAPVCGGSDIIHIVGEDGRVMRPSEVWTKMGMHNTSTPGDLLIDDLCDQMKTKATCKDGRRYMNFGDVQNMVKMKEDGNRSRFGDRDPSAEGKQSADDKSHTPVKKESCQDKAYHDPAECQARLNAAYIEANGGL
jgi:AP-1-like factor